MQLKTMDDARSIGNPLDFDMIECTHEIDPSFDLSGSPMVYINDNIESFEVITSEAKEHSSFAYE